MLGADSFVIACKAIVLFIYGTTFIFSIIFTFFIDTYNVLNGFLSLDFLSYEKRSPLENDIYFFDDWLIAHHKIIGPILVIVSLLDLVMLFKIINVL